MDIYSSTVLKVNIFIYEGVDTFQITDKTPFAIATTTPNLSPPSLTFFYFMFIQCQILVHEYPDLICEDGI
jgi:hypothetical protein